MSHLRAVPDLPANPLAPEPWPTPTVDDVITHAARNYYRRTFPNGTPYDHLDDTTRAEINQFVAPFVHDALHAAIDTGHHQETR